MYLLDIFIVKKDFKEDMKPTENIFQITYKSALRIIYILFTNHNLFVNATNQRTSAQT